jgi:hypothetical protein
MFGGGVPDAQVRLRGAKPSSGGQLPDLPSISSSINYEADLAGLFAPAGTPQDIIDKLEVGAILETRSSRTSG